MAARTKEFLVEFELEVPDGAPAAEVERRRREEAAAAAELAAAGHLVRLWTRPLVGDGTTLVGLYRAAGGAELAGLLAALPLADWFRTTVTALDPHPNDPQASP
jgi:muconolactone delta-isomerase